jgi:hypothetical protein
MTMFSTMTNGATQAFKFDPEVIAGSVSTKREKISAADIISLRDQRLLFLLSFPTGRWAASPELFSVTDANQELESRDSYSNPASREIVLWLTL